jgi:hypothetical protein
MRFENATRKNVKKCVLKMHLEKKRKNVKNVKNAKKMRNKCEKMRKNVKKRLKIQLARWNSDLFFFWFDFFGLQFCCSYFAACLTSAG